MRHFSLITAFLALIMASSSAYSALIKQADFTETLSLPYIDTLGPESIRKLEATAKVLSIQYELDDGDEIINSSPFNPLSGHADVNLSELGLLTLTGRTPDGFGDYQLAIFTISSIIFDIPTVITGVNILGLGNELFSNAATWVAPSPIVDFTDDSVKITYDVGSFLTTQQPATSFSFTDGQSAQFQLVLDDSATQPDPTINPVSAPSSLLLLAYGLLVLRLRRNKNHVIVRGKVI